MANGSSCPHTFIENSFEEELENADVELWADELLEDGLREGISKLTTPEELDNRSWIYEELQVGRPQRIHHRV